jgi:hypothetical protein
VTSSFEHHVVKKADVKILRDGKRMTIHIDASPVDRLTYEITDCTLSVVDAENGALRTAGRVRVEL